MAEVTKRTIFPIQTLRFVAAFVVAVSHVLDRMGEQAQRYRFNLRVLNVERSLVFAFSLL